MDKLKIGILASGHRKDGLVLLEEIKGGRLDAEVKIVISDKKALSPLKIEEACRKEGIPFYFNNPLGITREQYDKELVVMLEKYSVELVLLIGYMRILTKFFIKKYLGKVMNIHPSLLPAFAGGMDRGVHQAVLDSGVKITGCTLHFVTEEVDAGPIILQKAALVKESETVESLRDKVQVAEQEIIIKGIKLFKANRLKIEGKKVKILPRPHRT